jgi:hypothetical protein
VAQGVIHRTVTCTRTAAATTCAPSLSLRLKPCSPPDPEPQQVHRSDGSRDGRCATSSTTGRAGDPHPKAGGDHPPHVLVAALETLLPAGPQSHSRCTRARGLVTVAARPPRPPEGPAARTRPPPSATRQPLSLLRLKPCSSPDRKPQQVYRSEGSRDGRCATSSTTRSTRPPDRKPQQVHRSEGSRDGRCATSSTTGRAAPERRPRPRAHRSRLCV